MYKELILVHFLIETKNSEMLKMLFFFVFFNVNIYDDIRIVVITSVIIIYFCNDQIMFLLSKITDLRRFCFLFTCRNLGKRTFK